MPPRAVLYQDQVADSLGELRQAKRDLECAGIPIEGTSVTRSCQNLYVQGSDSVDELPQDGRDMPLQSSCLTERRVEARQGRSK